jgi:hypothetical protein
MAFAKSPQRRCVAISLIRCMANFCSDEPPQSSVCEVSPARRRCSTAVRRLWIRTASSNGFVRKQIAPSLSACARILYSETAVIRMNGKLLPRSRRRACNSMALISGMRTLVITPQVRSDRRGSEWRGPGFGTNTKCRGIRPMFRFLGRPSRRPEDSVREKSLVARVLPD